MFLCNSQPRVAYKSVAYKSVAYKSVAYKSVAYKSVANKSVAYKSVANKSVAYKSVAYKSVAYGSVAFPIKYQIITFVLRLVCILTKSTTQDMNGNTHSPTTSILLARNL